MKTNRGILLLLNLFSSSVLSQPAIQWESTYGYDSPTQPYTILEMNDGGFLAASTAGGSPPGFIGGNVDCWLIKTDANGVYQWEKFIGGTDDEEPGLETKKTKDGGVIIAGWTRSNDVDVSGNHQRYDSASAQWVNTEDGWIVKLDSMGTIQWQHCYGGSGSDCFFSIDTTSDGGYIAIGNTNSIDGDVTGMHDTSLSFCNVDCWVIKIDSAGTLQWSRIYGGSCQDASHDIIETQGGYLFIGLTNSNDFDVSGNHGQLDVWVVKTDYNGNILWQKCYGDAGNEIGQRILRNYDGGYLLTGHTDSPSLPSFHGSLDGYAVRIDGSGNIIWQKCYGGSDLDVGFAPFLQRDSTIILCGSAYSDDGDVSGNHSAGSPDVWMLCIDQSSAIKWQKCYGSPGYDYGNYAIPTMDNGYAIGAISYSVGGDVGTNFIPYGAGHSWHLKLLPPPITVGFTSAIPALCPGTCTDFTNLSQNALYFQWSFPGGIPASSTDMNPQNICYASTGSYDVQLIAMNANNSDTLLLTDYITVYPAPLPQAIVQSGDTLFAIASAASYQWYFNGNIIPGATGYFYVAQSSGDYNVVATDNNGCEVEAAIFSVVASTWFEVSGLRFEVFPNPAHETLFVNCYWLNGTAVEISVYNMIGEKIYSKDVQNGKRQAARSQQQEITIDVGSLAKGMYFLEAAAGSEIFRTKFIKL